MLASFAGIVSAILLATFHGPTTYLYFFIAVCILTVPGMLTLLVIPLSPPESRNVWKCCGGVTKSSSMRGKNGVATFWTRDVKSFIRTTRTAIIALRRNIIAARLLTCLGIIIGIAAVIAMMEIGQGSSATIQQTIVKMGRTTLIYSPDRSPRSG